MKRRDKEAWNIESGDSPLPLCFSQEWQIRELFRKSAHTSVFLSAKGLIGKSLILGGWDRLDELCQNHNLLTENPDLEDEP
jgi:hypothetical protein